MLGGLMSRLYMFETGMAKAYVPMALLWADVVGGGGTR